MGSVRWAFPCAAWAPRRDEWLLAARLVQPEEKDRVRQFVFARDAKAAMAGRLLIRKLIAEKLWIPWNEINLQRTSKGKPFLVNDILGIHPNFNFNVSHQGDYAVLAAEPELQVGIDIMKTNLPGSGSVPDFFRIMKRQFTEAEWRVIKSMNNEWIQLDMFYRHWALKESFIKAIGIGIGFNLQRIEFNASPLQLEVGKVYKETKMLLDGDKEEGWTFEQVIMSDITLMRISDSEKERMLRESLQRPGPYAAMLCRAMIPEYLIVSWCGNVSYYGGPNKAALPKNLMQRISNYLQESFLEMSQEDFCSIPGHIDRILL
ncbi:L-aminoadipate-semialdehyde dehydrogenase-phosphopantetheinyl transferase isoform X1 [Malaclemys terrapin pileata]|uniref:L-aminoadipate-semialdehyde dehydrogenase-phosphopantetheinyl transferase isoform X1 n=1 Tax=Malaclemys terrapin pileata TaxID=2991368 RepID=UPI0023A8FFE4|nr:L-aminoadipate-semialdehyde dehydrogenase-phosphopantetheinyl transferase isoform X1 [Malaclemys terrapin pileata]